MFQSPKNTTAYVAPAQPIDINQRYLVRVVELVDLGVDKFNPGDPDNPKHRIQWKFHMATIQGQPILDVEGNPYVHYDYSSSKTGKSKNASGKTATARLWMEALFGKPLEDEEIGANIATELRGKVAVALFEHKEKQSQAGEAYTQLVILRLSPKQGAPAAAPEPKPEPKPEPVAVAAAGAELPWN